MIRPAGAEDVAAIRDLVLGAFPTAAEAELVEALRAQGDMLVELVHQGAGGVDGHVAASAMQAPEGAAGLAPLAVAAGARGKGLGSGLVRAAIAALGRRGVPAVFVLGEPGFYGRFGFSVAAARPFASPYPPAYMMALELAPGGLAGRTGPLGYAPAFAGLG